MNETNVNQKLAAIRAIEGVFGDTTVDSETTFQSLLEIERKLNSSIEAVLGGMIEAEAGTAKKALRRHLRFRLACQRKLAIFYPLPG